MINNSIERFIIALFTPQGFEEVLLIGVLFLELMYVIFAFLMTRQIRIRNKSFCTPYEGLFSILGWLHFFATLVLLWITIRAL